MYGNVDLLSGGGFLSAVKGAQCCDGDVGAGQHEIQLTKSLKWGCISITCRCTSSTKRTGHQIGRKVFFPWTFGTKRGGIDDHQLRTSLLCAFQIGLGDAERPRAGKDNICLVY